MDLVAVISTGTILQGTFSSSYFCSSNSTCTISLLNENSNFSISANGSITYTAASASRRLNARRNLSSEQSVMNFIRATFYAFQSGTFQTFVTGYEIISLLEQKTIPAVSLGTSYYLKVSVPHTINRKLIHSIYLTVTKVSSNEYSSICWYTGKLLDVFTPPKIYHCVENNEIAETYDISVYIFLMHNFSPYVLRIKIPSTLNVSDSQRLSELLPTYFTTNSILTILPQQILQQSSAFSPQPTSTILNTIIASSTSTPT